MSLSFERTEYAEGRVLGIHIQGLNKAEHSLVNAPKLCERVKTYGYESLIMNYQGCQFDHTVSEFAKVAEILSSGMPRTLRIAYVYDETNLIHAAYITRLLMSAGLNARALGSFEDALAFASGQSQSLTESAEMQSSPPATSKP